MDAIFLKLLNMSVTAGWLVLAVVVLRLLLKKAPKAITVLLWAMVGIRLILPISFESAFSLIPSGELLPADTVYSHFTVEPEGAEILDYVNNNPVVYDLGIKDGSIVFSEFAAPDTEYVNPLRIITYVASIVWTVGMVLMLTYTVVSYLRIHLKVREAMPLKENIWICDRIDTPFILGIIKPRIYLPSTMNDGDAPYVIAHEKAHLKRRDHWWKPLGFLLLTVYWFHPLLWVAYLLLCRDIELACDEKVLKEMGTEIKKPYSDALINCSIPRKTVSACPLAFGEVGVKGRVKSVLHYKKPTVWVILGAIVVSIAVAIGFLTDPKRDLTKEITATTTKSDVAIDVLSVELGTETSTVLIRLKNGNDEAITYGDSFRLLRLQDGEWKNWQLNGIYSFGHAVHTLDAGDNTVLTYTWATADTSMTGKYRIEFDFELYDDWDAKTNQLVSRFQSGRLEFEVSEDLGIPNYTHFYRESIDSGPELRLNYVNKRFALVRNGKAVEEGTYSTEEIPGILILTEDGGKQYFFVSHGEDRIYFLKTHSDTMPDKILSADAKLRLSFRDFDAKRLFSPSKYVASMYGIDTGEGWAAELWLSDYWTSMSGQFFIWTEPLREGGIRTCITGHYQISDNEITCTATDGNVYRFKLSDIKNTEDQGNDGYRPLRYPIYLEGTAPLPFSVGEELTYIS